MHGDGAIWQIAVYRFRRRFRLREMLPQLARAIMLRKPYRDVDFALGGQFSWLEVRANR